MQQIAINCTGPFISGVHSIMPRNRFILDRSMILVTACVIVMLSGGCSQNQIYKTMYSLGTGAGCVGPKDLGREPGGVEICKHNRNSDEPDYEDYKSARERELERVEKRDGAEPEA